MKREWMLPRHGGDPERAVEVGQALGILASDETIESITQLLSLMDRLGGQLYFNAVRVPYDAQGNQLDESRDDLQNADWETIGYRVVYESRDIRLIGKIPEPPEEVEVPVDFPPEPESAEE